VALSDWERKIFAAIQAEFHRACQRSNLRQLGITILFTALFEVVGVALLFMASQADTLAMSATAVLVVCLALFAAAVVPRPVPATLPVRRWPPR
jgi:predicted RND superfamily exporter protein